MHGATPGFPWSPLMFNGKRFSTYSCLASAMWWTVCFTYLGAPSSHLIGFGGGPSFLAYFLAAFFFLPFSSSSGFGINFPNLTLGIAYGGGLICSIIGLAGIFGKSVSSVPRILSQSIKIFDSFAFYLSINSRTSSCSLPLSHSSSSPESPSRVLMTRSSVSFVTICRI